MILGTKPSRIFGRRLLAVAACVALLCFVVGDGLFHDHTGGTDTTCPVCQLLHLPMLVPAALHFDATPQLITQYSSLPRQIAPSDPSFLHHASRAPPIA